MNHEKKIVLPFKPIKSKHSRKLKKIKKIDKCNLRQRLSRILKP